MEKEEIFHVIINSRTENNLEIVSHKQYLSKSETIEVCNGSYCYCETFHSKFSEEVPYPLVDMEELC